MACKAREELKGRSLPTPDQVSCFVLAAEERYQLIGGNIPCSIPPQNGPGAGGPGIDPNIGVENRSSLIAITIFFLTLIPYPKHS